jgi:hypothetical protein
MSNKSTKHFPFPILPLSKIKNKTTHQLSTNSSALAGAGFHLIETSPMLTCYNLLPSRKHIPNEKLQKENISGVLP